MDVDAAIPAVLSDIVSKCLERDPEARFASVQELIDELEIWQGKKPRTGPIGVGRLRRCRRHCIAAPASVCLEVDCDRGRGGGAGCRRRVSGFVTRTHPATETRSCAGARNVAGHYSVLQRHRRLQPELDGRQHGGNFELRYRPVGSSAIGFARPPATGVERPADLTGVADGHSTLKRIADLHSCRHRGLRPVSRRSANRCGSTRLSLI